MDDTFLYNYIKKIIHQKKTKPKFTDDQSFAQKYCQRELVKKKLLTKSNSKMSKLMKNFQHVDTYVDLHFLINEINEIRIKQQRKDTKNNGINGISNTNVPQEQQFSSYPSVYLKQNQQQLSKNHQYFLVAQSSPIPNSIKSLQQRVHDKISNIVKNRHQLQSIQMNKLIKKLQQKCFNQLYNNNDNNYTHLDGYLKKLENQDEKDNSVSCSNIINLSKENCYDLGDIHNHSINKKNKSQFKSTNINSKQARQEYQLLHKITTYLQIALEHQHKSKWATKQHKKFRNTHGSFRFNKTKDKSSFFLQDYNQKIQSEKQKLMQKLNNTQDIIIKNKQQKEENNKKKSYQQQVKISNKQNKINNFKQSESIINIKQHKNTFQKIKLAKTILSIHQTNKERLQKQTTQSTINLLQAENNSTKSSKEIQKKVYRLSIPCLQQCNQTNNQCQPLKTHQLCNYIKNISFTQQCPQIISLQKRTQQVQRQCPTLSNIISPKIMIKKYRNSRLYPNNNIDPNDLFKGCINKSKKFINQYEYQQQSHEKNIKNYNINQIIDKSYQNISEDNDQNIIINNGVKNKQKQLSFTNHINNKNYKIKQNFNFIASTKLNYQSKKKVNYSVFKQNLPLNKQNDKPILNLSLKYSTKQKQNKKQKQPKNSQFKKRSKKQFILNKIQSFIKDVDYSQKVSKVQNQYYEQAITKLQQMSKQSYQNFMPQTLAYDEEIYSLKKFINGLNTTGRKNNLKKNK